MTKKLWGWSLILFGLTFVGCGNSLDSIPEKLTPLWSNNDSEIEFTSDEAKLLRQHGLVLFRGKIILDAQPPISSQQKEEIQNQLTGPIPADLLDLWNVSFGGTLDYDYEVTFGEHLYPASFREVFYSESDHYRDINGWIQQEAQGASKTPILPFGGYEYLERAFVIVEGKKAGKVIYWAEGLPDAWKTRLNESSMTISAGGINDIFDQLYLTVDPFLPVPEDRYPNGLEIAEKVEEIALAEPELGRKLRDLVKENVFHWRLELPEAKGDSYTDIELRAIKLGLTEAAQEDDRSIVDLFVSRGLPLNLTIRSESGILPEAMRHGSFVVVTALLDQGIDVGDSVVVYIDDATPPIIKALMDAGKKFDVEAVLSLAEQGHLEAAESLARSENLSPKVETTSIAAEVSERAVRADESAKDVERGTLYSSTTSAEYQANAKNLRAFLHLIK